jgi:hypothetical protein
MDPIRRLTATALPIITVLALGTIATGPAGGAASGTSCTFEVDVVASPGLSTSGSSGTVGSEKDGTAACNGPVNGKQPSGPGTVGFKGRYGTKDPDTCQAGGEGDGVLTLTIPTSDGSQKIDNKETYTYGAFKAGTAFSGEFKGDRMSGTFEVQPIDGDCASKPVTKFRVKGKGTLTG